MESSKLTLIYNLQATPHITVADGINSLYLHSVLNNEVVVRVTPYLPATQVLCITFAKDGVPSIDTIVMAKRQITEANSTHEVNDDNEITTLQEQFGGWEWYTAIPQAVLDNVGEWTLSLDVREPSNLLQPLQSTVIATSGNFTFTVNSSVTERLGRIPTEFDILNLYVTAVQMAENSEAWAVGERGGVPVESTDGTYHNNAKYWADKSQEYAGDSADSATEASGYADNAETSAGNANTYAQQASGYATNAQASAQSASGYASLSSGYADNSQASAEASAQSASQASNSESASELSAQSASASASSAEASAQRAEAIASTIMPPIAVSYVTNPVFNSQAEYITISTPITDIDGKVWQIADLKVGGTVWVIENGVPDRWVASVQNGVAQLYKQEVEVAIPVTSVNGQIGDIETYKQTYSATAHYYKGDWVSNSTGDLVYFCIQTAPIGTALTNRAYFRPFAVVGADGKISADVLPTVSVLLETEDTQTVAGESLPVLTGTQLTQAYNGIVAGQTVTIANPDGDEHIRVLEAFADGNDIQIIVGYKDKLFKYSADGDITVVFNPADKQAQLVSGTNIKTINGNSILGSGNIEIQGGGSIAKNDVIDRRETLPQATASSADFVEVGSVLYAKTKFIAWDEPTITLSGDVVTTPIVEGVTMYKVYSNGSYIGYVDSDNVWHGEVSE